MHGASNGISPTPHIRTSLLFLTMVVITIVFSHPQAFAANVRQRLLKSDEEELKTLQEELQNGKGLSEKDKKVKQGLFQRKLQEYQKRGQEFQVELSQKQQNMVKEYMDKIETATQAVADRHGFSLVIDKGSEATLKIVLYSRKGLDITNEVVKEFDKRFP